MDCPILYRSMIKHFKRVAFSLPFDPTLPICTSIVTITLCSPCGSHLPVVNACWEKVSPFHLICIAECSVEAFDTSLSQLHHHHFPRLENLVSLAVLTTP